MKFVILGLPKTGKTMLVNTLNRLPNFRVLGEIMNTRGPNPNMPLHPQRIIQDMREVDTKHNLHTWITNKYLIERTDITAGIRPGDIDQFMKTIFLENKFCGFKLHHHHIELIPYLKTWILDRTDEIKIIHCNRENKIKQALAAIGNRARGKRFFADPQSTVNLMHDNDQRFRELRKWFFHKTNYREFLYEDMTHDTDTKTLDIRPIRDFLQIDMPSSMDVLTHKNTRNKISENLTNFDEVAEFFKDNSEWID